jgi:Helix-turn-helix domain
MSVKAMVWVLEHSDETLGRRLVLLALADKANDDGTGAWPSVETLARSARLSTRQVQRCLRDLERSGAIVREGTSSYGTTQWGVNMSGRQSVGGDISDREGATSSASYGAVAVTQTVLSKPSIEPSNIMSEARSGPSDEAIYLSRRLAAQIRSRDPKAKVAPDSRRWLDAARLLLERDGRSVEEVEAVLDWLPFDSFWPSVILSMPKLREKFTQLVAASARNGGESNVQRLHRKLNQVRVSHA